jgi:hypothetical protein
MRLLQGMSLMCTAIVGCASGAGAVGPSENYGFKNGVQVWVRGPWTTIRASTNADEVIDQLCPAVMSLDRAQLREYGQEYCGAIYSLGDGHYYASMPSPLGKTVLVGPSKRKQCIPPRFVEDARGRASVLADFHSHPWSPSAMTPDDLMAKTQLWSIRIQFDTTCHIQKLIPYSDENRPGEVYERQGKSWKLVGIIKPEDKPYGIITAVDDNG